MQVATVPSVSIDETVVRDAVFYAEVPRGTGLDATIEVRTVDGSRATISGAQLRAALLSAVHTGPWVPSDIGADREVLQLDPGGRSATIAHLDASGNANPSYWLYRRLPDGPVRLTRWTRAGYNTRRSLISQAGIDAVESLSEAGAERELTRLVADGLPRRLTLTFKGKQMAAEAPDPGWLDVPPGALKANPDRVPIHAVEDLGDWPNDGA